MVMEQKFRSDLFYRLNVFPIRVPPLRERREDIPILVSHFVFQFARQMNKRIESITSETMSALCNHRWPGNIRGLQNVLERAMILSSGPAIGEHSRRGAPKALVEMVGREQRASEQFQDDTFATCGRAE